MHNISCHDKWAEGKYKMQLKYTNKVPHLFQSYIMYINMDGVSLPPTEMKTKYDISMEDGVGSELSIMTFHPVLIPWNKTQNQPYQRSEHLDIHLCDKKYWDKLIW